MSNNINNNNNNNTTRRILINNYLNMIDENNNNMSQLINIMTNQENTIRRLLFENENENQNTSRTTVYSPLYNNLSFTRPFRNNESNITSTLNRNNYRNPNRNYDSLTNLDNLVESFFDTIPVIPTQAQINNALTHNIYSEIENPINSTCPISLRRFQNDDEVSVIRHCNHIFSRDELQNWFRSNCRCPLCRYDIRTYTRR